MQLPLEAVQEFVISTQRFSAANGRSEGAAINMITKSGGNSLSRLRFRLLPGSNSSNATDTLAAQSGQKPPYSRQFFGGSVGGPSLRTSFSVSSLSSGSVSTPVLLNLRTRFPNCHSGGRWLGSAAFRNHPDSVFREPLTTAASITSSATAKPPTSATARNPITAERSIQRNRRLDRRQFHQESSAGRQLHAQLCSLEHA